MKTLSIIGSAPSYKDALCINDSEIWTLNTKFNIFKNFTRHFDVHIPYFNYSHQFEGYCDFLRKNQDKLWILDYSDDYPDANVINADFLLEKHNYYFTSSISWMLAQAIEEDYDTIRLYGIELQKRSEYENQRACIEYFIGYAKGKGVNIYIHPSSTLLKTKEIYGYKYNESY